MFISELLNVILILYKLILSGIIVNSTVPFKKLNDFIY